MADIGGIKCVSTGSNLISQNPPIMAVTNTRNRRAEVTPIPSISPPLWVVAGLVLFVLGVVESPLLSGMTVVVVVDDEDDVVVIVDSFLVEISEITFF